MQHLVIGLGEVGSAVKEILKCHGLDFNKDSSANGGPYDMIHICFPYSDSFVLSVKNYQNLFKARYVVIHSTVPLGTCDPHHWIHSPIRGIHPNLVEGIKTFTKYFGGVNAEVAAHEFAEKKITTLVTTKASHTEALKLWDTTQYGVMIALQKEIYAYCNRHDLPFDLVYKHANMSYNEGYTKLEKPEVVRPYLDQKDGPIGGHCVMPNAMIIREQEAGAIMEMLSAFIRVNQWLEKPAFRSQESAQTE